MLCIIGFPHHPLEMNNLKFRVNNYGLALMVVKIGLQVSSLSDARDVSVLPKGSLNNFTFQ